MDAVFVGERVHLSVQRAACRNNVWAAIVTGGRAEGVRGERFWQEALLDIVAVVARVHGLQYTGYHGRLLVVEIGMSRA